MEDTFYHKEGKFRYAVDSTIDIAKKFYKPSDSITENCIRVKRKCCELPTKISKSSLKCIYKILKTSYKIFKTKILQNTDKKD